MPRVGFFVHMHWPPAIVLRRAPGPGVPNATSCTRPRVTAICGWCSWYRWTGSSQHVSYSAIDKRGRSHTHTHTVSWTIAFLLEPVNFYMFGRQNQPHSTANSDSPNHGSACLQLSLLEGSALAMLCGTASSNDTCSFLVASPSRNGVLVGDAWVLFPNHPTTTSGRDFLIHDPLVAIIWVDSRPLVNCEVVPS